MHKEPFVNGHIHQREKTTTVSHVHDKNTSNDVRVSMPIPTDNIGLHRKLTESDDSNDSLSNGATSPAEHSPVTAFSRSLSGPNAAANSLNVYSMSPRSTQFMYQYYSNPKGFYQNQTPLVHASRSVSGRPCTDDHFGVKMRPRTYGRVRTTSDCCGSPPKLNTSLMLSGIPQTLHHDVLEDPRRRAWSESDSHKKSNMNMSRMSALKKLKKKLGRSGSLKKKKDEINHNETLNRSVASINSLEKVEEGRQLACKSKSASPSSSKRSPIVDDLPDFQNFSIHQEDETMSPNNLSPDSIGCGIVEKAVSPFSEAALSLEGDLIYQRFLEEHTCYDIMPTSCKLVVFDTHLQARKAFHALIENSVRSAPLWDSEVCCYVGMLTVTDFIQVILVTHRSLKARVKSVEEQTIESWRRLLGQQLAFANVLPSDTLLHSLKVLMNEHFHGVPILDETTGDIFHIINHKRILRFLHLFMNELPKPSFLNKSLSEVKLGTYDDVATVTKHHTMLEVLELIVKKKVSAIPVVDDDGEVMDVFCKLDMISLAAQGLYHDLSMTMEIALAYRFTPLFEDEECPADAFTRFSSPQPQRRNVSAKPSSITSGNDTKQSPNTFLKDHKSNNQTSARGGHSAIKGHSAISGKNESSPQKKREAPHVSQPSVHPESETVTPECTDHHRIRHKSLSNPLVKCQLSDKLQKIIDLMVTTDANLLVVVGRSSNRVIGVITVSDVLYYIVNPQGRCLSHTSTYIHKKVGKNISAPAVSSSSTKPFHEVASPVDDSEDPFVSAAIVPSGLPSSKLPSSPCASIRDDSSVLKKTSNLTSFRHDGSRPRSHLNKSDQKHVNARFLHKGDDIKRS